MTGINTTVYFLTMVTVALFFVTGSVVYSNLSVTERDLIIEEQTVYRDITGDYFPETKTKDYQVHVYRKWCEGFIIQEETDTEIIRTAYGDLSDSLTVTYDKPVIKETIPSTTPIDSGTTTIER